MIYLFFRNAILTITVTDVNDNLPQFIIPISGLNYYNFQIYEVRTHFFLISFCCILLQILFGK